MPAIYFGEYDSYGNSLDFTTTQWLAVGAPQDWTQYTLTLPVYSQAASCTLARFLTERERRGLTICNCWWIVNRLRTRPQWAAFPWASPGTTSFDNGSGIAITSLSDIQIQKPRGASQGLGISQYYHPAVTTRAKSNGLRLFRAIPPVLAAGDAPTANRAILAWITARSAVQLVSCSPR